MTAAISATGDREKQPQLNQPTELMVRIRRALWLVRSMLALSLLLVTLGIFTTTRTESVAVSGYVSGVAFTLGSFLGLLGLALEENRRHLITAAMVFLSLGVIASFLCLMIDGASTALNMDVRPLRAGRCQYYSSGDSFLYENYYATVSCRTLEETCNMTVRSRTCYCCDLYNCANGGYLNYYYEFVGVQSCQDVFTLYFLMWSLTGLNLVAFFMGVLTTAVLGSIMNMRGPDPVMRGVSSPTAPLLTDANSLHVKHLHPGASLYFPSSPSSSSPAAAASVQQPLVSQSFPDMCPGTAFQTLPFAPLSY